MIHFEFMLPLNPTHTSSMVRSRRLKMKRSACYLVEVKSLVSSLLSVLSLLFCSPQVQYVQSQTLQVSIKSDSSDKLAWYWYWISILCHFIHLYIIICYVRCWTNQTSELTDLYKQTRQYHDLQTNLRSVTTLLHELVFQAFCLDAYM